MDFLTGDVKKLYFKFLSASVTSALVVSVYAFVDTIAVGQSEGPLGTAAMAVVTPLYGLSAFFAILCGIGGSVQMSKAKGSGNEEKGNACFSSALLAMGAITALFWLALICFHEQILTFFGATEEIMPKVMAYCKWVIVFLPAFMIPPFIGAFIRNDGAPGLVMTAVIAGGCVNMFGDWFFVFPMGMGMTGAAVASVIGTIVQTIIMCTHFFRKSCHLKLAKPFAVFRGIRSTIKVGFCSGVIELGAVFTAVLMNNQIIKYGGTTELAVYGVLVTILQLFTAVFSGVGQAIQPLVSSNYGAGNHERNRQFLKMSMLTVGIMGAVFTVVGELFPVGITKLFIDATPAVIQAAPSIFGIFFLLFIPSGVTVLAVYYLQSTMQHKMAIFLSVLKGVLVSGAFILILPIFFKLNGVWAAMPCSEVLVAAISVCFIRKISRRTDIKAEK